MTSLLVTCYRVSTDWQDSSGLDLDAQRTQSPSTRMPAAAFGDPNRSEGCWLRGHGLPPASTYEAL